ncbi:Phage holin, LL-H family [uncultured Caudovirales phage]|uniref:Phage holin, LL-H family n=1 Tax=uncultured Caudovirales phage TaxID=2100421 RepID=A0A6J5Q201_9CAUD|nr:Phage holin, LL-H family [uncultured Caudovirales phage]CAB4199751.1 Phage holin, LL-H family [uncultured Caudovirales phage]CAB4218445.1 Phage holin, LL-H family [uncultured Caudovirales phage]
MEVFVNALVNAAAPVLVAGGVAAVAWLLKNVNSLVRANTNDKQYTTLTNIVNTVVRAVEQEHWIEDGEVKKNIAYQQIAEHLHKYGVKLDFEVIDSAIEAAVLKEFGASNK